jgi:ADP-heptose:LPS heptosyltransferase
MHSRLRAAATVSLGVGENPAKRIGGKFEGELLRMLAEKYESVLVDTGAGGEEKERVLKAVDEAGAPNLRTWSGPFAPFADAISKSRLYVGYDSAGQHVAAACGTPLLTMFAGYASERMFHRWYPSGKGTARVMRVEDPDPEAVLGRVREELQGM